mmetsp:Transcript_39199/g.111143  ORF Transcript_39199/g.111143 Transcript_39199/m.111143 type:complete len:216 (-) Transcript_39199:164-811(-)
MSSHSGPEMRRSVCPFQMDSRPAFSASADCKSPEFQMMTQQSQSRIVTRHSKMMNQGRICPETRFCMAISSAASPSTLVSRKSLRPTSPLPSRSHQSPGLSSSFFGFDKAMLPCPSSCVSSGSTGCEASPSCSPGGPSPDSASTSALLCACSSTTLEDGRPEFCSEALTMLVVWRRFTTRRLFLRMKPLSCRYACTSVGSKSPSPSTSKRAEPNQ